MRIVSVTASLACCGIAAVASLSMSQALATEVYFALGYDPNQRALAGAGVAYGHEVMSVTVNPALAARVGHELQLGLEFFSPDRGYTATGTGFMPNGRVERGSNLF